MDTTDETFALPAHVLERPDIDPATTAVVVIDMINWQVPREPNDSGLAPQFLVDQLADVVIPNHVRLLAACREAGIEVVFLRLGSAMADYSDSQPLMRETLRMFHAADGTQACDVIDELLEPGDTTMLKVGSGGFNSSELDSHLRDAGITTVIYTGVVTNACVLLTAAAGFDLGYLAYLVSDATTTFTAELQIQAENIIGQFMARPISTDQMIAAVAASTTAGAAR